jgi:hypothetical protein
MKVEIQNMRDSDILLSWFRILSVLSEQALMVKKIFMKNMNLDILLASMKTLTNSEDCTESRSRILLQVSSSVLGWFSPALNHHWKQEMDWTNVRVRKPKRNFSGGLRNNYYTHRNVTEQNSLSQPASCIPQNALWRGLLEWFLILVNVFIEAIKNCNLNFLHNFRKARKKFKNHQRTYIMYWFDLGGL